MSASLCHSLSFPTMKEPANSIMNGRQGEGKKRGQGPGIKTASTADRRVKQTGTQELGEGGAPLSPSSETMRTLSLPPSPAPRSGFSCGQGKTSAGGGMGVFIRSTGELLRRLWSFTTESNRKLWNLPKWGRETDQIQRTMAELSYFLIGP